LNVPGRAAGPAAGGPPVRGEGLLPSEEDDAVKQIQALFISKEIPAGSSPDSQPPTTENAIFVKSHLKK
jgi:hypothetical protein